MDKLGRLMIENDAFSSGNLYAVRDGQTVLISVEEEKAMDSYNEDFECTCGIDLEQAVTLRDWLSSVIASMERSTET